MSKATSYTLSLIQKAKEVASKNKILKRQRDKQQLDESLEYIHKHLDEWYAKHIADMEKWDHLNPLYFRVTDISDAYLHYLGKDKWHKYSVYKFRALAYTQPSILWGMLYLEVYVNG